MRMVIPNSTGRLLDEISTDVNAFFETMMKDHAEKSDFVPLMDFEDQNEAYVLALDLPGVDHNDIEVDVEEDHVIIHGQRHRPGGEEGQRRRVERSFGAFRRVLRLPKQIDRDSVTAKFENGVLTVALPKAVKNKRRVVISHGSAPEASTDSAGPSDDAASE